MGLKTLNTIFLFLTTLECSCLVIVLKASVFVCNESMMELKSRLALVEQIKGRLEAFV